MTHKSIVDNHANFFYQNILENDVTIFSVGRIWLYFYGPLMIGIRDFQRDGLHTLYLLRQDATIEGILSPVRPTKLQFETIRAGLRDQVTMLDHGELSAMAFALTFPEFRENNGGSPAAQWLLDFLVEAKSRRLCTKVVCTTCGAREFRNRLRAATAQAIVDFEPQAVDQHSGPTWRRAWLA
jgi:hypothetical protein